MRISLNNININTEIYSEDKKDYLFLLHGFTGSSDDWKGIAEGFGKNYNVIAADLIGHGSSSSPSEIVHYSADDLCAQLFFTIRSFTTKPVILLGYSMGGRAAISFAVRFPEQLKGLILEGASAGIRNDKERSERVIKDFELASMIEKNSIEYFVDYWMNLEIFATQQRFSNTRLQEIRSSKILKNNNTGLANSLKGFSSGIMPPLYDKLKTFKIPSLLLTGELDTKFSLLNSNMESLFYNARHVTIKNAGHNTHLEEPEKFIRAVSIFLKLVKY